MATINQILTAEGFVIYEVEKSNWQVPSVLTFDSRNSIALTSDNIIDIVLLGDGYLSSDISDFEGYISDWYDDVFAIWPYSQFVNAFRVRAVFTPSTSRFDSSGNGYFGLKHDTAGNQVDADLTSEDFRSKLFDILRFVEDNSSLNMRTYPADLSVGWSGDSPKEISVIPTARDSDTYQNLLRNCVVAMSVYTSSGSTSVSGFTTVDVSDTVSDTKISIAIGETLQHEFSHAFGLLRDEYIGDSLRGTLADKQEPSIKSVFDLWNLCYTGIGEQVPWFHLSWAGKYQRSKDSFVSQQWIGGQNEKCVWHCEYMCLMNGGHENYFYSTDEALGSFANLRTTTRFCLWCEEILTIKILEKTDAFLRFDDVLSSGGDINKLGQIWYHRWVNELRDAYWSQFDLETRIKDRETWYNTSANISTNVPGQDLHGTDLMRKIILRKPAGNLGLILCDLDD